MERRFQQLLIGVLSIFMSWVSTEAQNVSVKHLSAKHKTYYDSLKNMNYDRVFPIFGTKVYKRGFDIPFPFGIMINTFYCKQGIDITNVRVGIVGPNNSLGPVNLDSIIQFGDVDATAVNLNLRADWYIFPFLNVYAMLNYLPHAKTEVTLVKPIELHADPKQDGWAYGFGVMGAFGFGPVWLQADYNLTWADMELLDNTVFTQVAGVRMGHVFPGKKDPESNLSIWIGAMGIFLNNRTVGQIAFTEIFPSMTEAQVTQARANYNSHSTITPLQKQVMDGITDRILDRIHGLPLDESYITYELDKAPSSEWAGLMGVQFQFNKRWQLRSESNFIGKDRFSVLLSINYRFMGFKKKTK